MSNSKRVNTVTAIAALGAVAITGAAAGILSSKKLSAATPISAPPNATLDRNLPASFSAIIDRVGPAVVSIRVTGKVPRAGAPLSEIPEPFKRFFGDKFGFGNPGEGSPQRGSKVQGMGSGFFIDAKGHVVTNNHVVGDAEKIEIMLKDGDTYEATLVGRDPKTDLALLKVTSDRKFPFVRFGRSSDAKVGDWVIALGSPFGLGQTATTGIVSARGRDIGAGPYDDFLQIDAPINKGNSGGPTFNTRGEVIGINTAIISPTGVSAGIGFAVPSDMAKSVIAQLKDKGAVARGWLGVNIQRVTKDLAAGLGMKTPEGALVSNVTEDSPAAKAGLKAGDVIVAVEDERIEKMRELPRRVARLAADQTANFTIVRNGRERIIDVVIGKMPGAKKKAAATTDKSNQTALWTDVGGNRRADTYPVQCRQEYRRRCRYCRRARQHCGRKRNPARRCRAPYRGSGNFRPCRSIQASCNGCRTVQRQQTQCGPCTRQPQGQRPLHRAAAARRLNGFTFLQYGKSVHMPPGAGFLLFGLAPVPASR